MLSMRRILVPSIVGALALGTSCSAPEPPPEGAPTLSVQSTDPITGRISFDRTSTATVTLRSVDKTGAPDLGAVTATAEKDGDLDRGFLAVEGSEEVTEPTATGTPNDQGLISFLFKCNDAGRVDIAFSSTSGAQTSSSISCRSVVLTLDVDPDNGCNALRGDATSNCSLDITATTQTGAEAPVPAASERIEITAAVVAGTVELLPASDADPDGDAAILSTTSNGPLSDHIDGDTLLTGADGKATFFVRSPALGLAEDVELTIVVGSETTTQIISLDQFVSNATIVLTATPQTVLSGSNTALKVVARGVDGQPAAGKTVTLALGDGLLVGGQASASLTLDAQGSATATAAAEAGLFVARDADVIASFDTGLDPDIVPVLTDSKTVTIEPSVVYTIDVDRDRSCATLQGDARSKCGVSLTLTKQASGQAVQVAANEAITVNAAVVAGSAELLAESQADPDGEPAILAQTATGALSSTLTGVLTTDANGKARFFVRSPAFGLAQNVDVTIATAGASTTEQFAFTQFENRGTLTVVASPATVFGGQSTTLAIAARAVDGTPAAGETVAVTLGAGLLVGGQSSTTLTLDSNGRAVATAVSDATIVATTTANVTATYDLAVDASVPPLSTVATVGLNAPFTFAIDIDQDQECATLQGDGISSCGVTLTVTKKAFNGLDPVPAANQAISVEAAILGGSVQILPGAVADPDGQPEVLATTSTGAGAASLRGVLTTDASGRARFFVRSPAFGLAQIVDINVTSGNATATDAFAFAQFVNRASVTVTANPSSVTAGFNTTLTVSAVGADGRAASGDSVSLTASGGLFFDSNAATLTKSVTLDGNGRATVIAGSGATPGTASIVATYDTGVDASIAPVDTLTTVTLLAGNAPTVTASLSPTTIRSDTAIPEQATLTFAGSRNGSAFNTARITVDVDPASRALVDIGTAGSDTATINALTAGAATLTVFAQAGARGDATLHINAVDTSSANAPIGTQIDLVVTVARAPVLQTIRFVSATPSTIGVRGSALQTSTVVAFQILDDLNAPMQGIPVTFAKNATADQGITLVTTSISDAAGNVSTVLSSGTIAGPVTVVATAARGTGGNLSSQSTPIAIIGGLPNSTNSFLVCAKSSDNVSDGVQSACTVSLVDRFTNVVGALTNVQFRAEGGSIDPFVAASTGAATANYKSGEPGAAGADVRDWSHGRFVPTSAAQLGTGLAKLTAGEQTAINGCFDRTVGTPCDLVTLCRAQDSVALNANEKALFAAACPLPAALDGAARCDADISATSSTLQATEAAGANAFLQSFLLGTNAAQVATYLAEYRACGAPLACLNGDSDGLDVGGIVGAVDNCPNNAGCYDFSGSTECPQNGLLTIMAEMRGEEGFVDRDGNGAFDPGIDQAIDMPEPFLDKNDSCSRDDLNNSPRLSPTDEIRTSDLFSDVDGNGSFGFDSATGIAETNGTYDSDTEVFLTTHILGITDGALDLGEFVGNVHVAGQEGSFATCLASPACGQGLSTGATGSCVETADGDVIRLCPFSSARDGASGSYVFRWRDAEGNCPNEDFASPVPTVTAAAPVKITAKTLVNATSGNCGFSGGTAAAQNADRPWCEEMPRLGAPTSSIAFAVDCEGVTGSQVVDVTFALGTDTETRSLTVNCPECGDGIVEGAETCDDSNTTAADGCDATCALEPGFFCDGNNNNVPDADCRAVSSLCGDGKLAPNGGEVCDDGNTTNGDGCSSACKVETGKTCTSVPGAQSVCQ